MNALTIDAYLNELNSFLNIKQDEEYSAINPESVKKAKGILEDFFAREAIIPMGLVPTRSGGVAMDYKVNDDASAYYTIAKDGSINLNVITGKKGHNWGTYYNPGKLLPTPRHISEHLARHSILSPEQAYAMWVDCQWGMAMPDEYAEGHKDGFIGGIFWLMKEGYIEITEKGKSVKPRKQTPTL